MPSADPFDELLIAHLPRLRRYAHFLTRNRVAADDLVQETAYRALRFRSQFQAGTSFAAWTARILRNEFMAALRRSKQPLDSIDKVPEKVLGMRGDQEDVVFSRQIIRMMGKLRPRQREALALVFIDGATYEEAADALKCKVITIKSRLWHARRHMAAMLLGEIPLKMPGSPDPAGHAATPLAL